MVLVSQENTNQIMYARLFAAGVNYYFGMRKENSSNISFS